MVGRKLPHVHKSQVCGDIGRPSDEKGDKSKKDNKGTLSVDDDPLAEFKGDPDFRRKFLKFISTIDSD